MGKSSQRRFLVVVSGIDGTFERKTGGNGSVEITRSWDGGAVDPDILTSPASYSDLTVGRTFYRYRDHPVIARLRPRIGRSTHTITVTPLDEDMVAQAGKTSYTGLLIGINEPDVDSKSSSEAAVELMFAVSKVR